MSAMHPLGVVAAPGLSAKELKTFESIKAHFTGDAAQELEGFVYASLMLLRATLFVRVKSEAA